MSLMTVSMAVKIVYNRGCTSLPTCWLFHYPLVTINLPVAKCTLPWGVWPSDHRKFFHDVSQSEKLGEQHATQLSLPISAMCFVR
jgi:hypothetical protein